MISKNQIKFIRQLESKKFRRREGLFVAEGPKVVGDLMKHTRPQAIFATKEWAMSNVQSLNLSISQSLNVQCSEVSDEELRRISFLQHPQQVLALFPLPKDATSESSSRPFASGISASGQTIFADSASKDSPLVLALDGVQDPGNLGTIIRLADWFGIDTIICSEETADGTMKDIKMREKRRIIQEQQDEIERLKQRTLWERITRKGE